MRLIERYIFGRMVGTMLLSFLALATMIWLSLALRQFELVTNQGQSVWTFLNVSAFLVPILVMIVLPIAVLIAVVYTFTTLNGDSELVVINASGASQAAMLKPALLIGLITAILVGAMSIYFTPLSLRLGQVLITQVRGNILASIVRDGQFVSLAGGLTFHIKGRNPDGSFRGIFVSDDRDPGKTITYLAEKGAIIDNPLGVFLVMGNGTIQQRSKVDQTILMIEFSSYAFDLSTFASGGTVPTARPRERPTAYLLNPDADDTYFRQFPEQFTAELHDRLSAPLYGFVFALLPLLFLGQARSARESMAASIAMAVGAVLLIRAVGFLVIHAAKVNTAAVVFLYALPLAVAALAAVLVANGTQLSPPQRVLAIGETLLGRIRGLLRNRSEAPVRGAG